MKIGIMQPYFFPYLAYWQLINAVDRYVVYDDVTYIKGGWINRNNILLNGQKHMMTLQLDNSSSNRLICDIMVRNDAIEKKKLLKKLEYAYKKAPYYETVIPMITELIMMDTTIAELNYEAVKRIDEFLGIDTEILLSSQMEIDPEAHGADRVIDVTKSLGGDEYINAIGGIEMYSKEQFSDNGIKLGFLKKENIEYPQFGNEFIDDLSIIDVLMFNDVDKIRELLGRYRFIS